jgi:hypothetical protein
MDTTWPYNFDCAQLPRHIPKYYDNLIVPAIFYEAVIERNTEKLNNLIKYNQQLSVAVVSFYDTTLKNAFFYKKNAKFEIPYKIRWKTKTQNNSIIMNFNEQAGLYDYITKLPWAYTNMGFLINTINNYLVQLRYVMGLINNHIPVNQYYNLGVNVHNNAEMKYYISTFIPNMRFQ